MITPKLPRPQLVLLCSDGNLCSILGRSTISRKQRCFWPAMRRDLSPDRIWSWMAASAQAGRLPPFVPTVNYLPHKSGEPLGPYPHNNVIDRKDRNWLNKTCCSQCRRIDTKCRIARRQTHECEQALLGGIDVTDGTPNLGLCRCSAVFGRPRGKHTGLHSPESDRSDGRSSHFRNESGALPPFSCAR